MVTDARKSAVLVLMLCLCVNIFIPIATARDAFAPSWLKEGAYIKYGTQIVNSNSSGFMSFFDLSNPKFAGINYTLPAQKVDAVLETKSSSLVWRCVSVNATMAKLQVTLDYVGNAISSFENVTIQRTVEVYVDLYTRGVYNVDGVFLGTTHLWLPANPNNGQEITIWEEDTEIITLPVTISDQTWGQTVQGLQYFFQTGSQVTIKNNPLMLGLAYDLDTGLCVSGILMWDPIFAAVGISQGTVGRVSETNIDLGPERSAINWMQMLFYAIIPVAIILLIATLVIKRKKKKN
ncbi:MAG: hypothetical protein ACFCUE_15900 [Candidatus Bathyarchaeia archaeon]|jgi:hypothetical protein